MNFNVAGAYQYSITELSDMAGVSKRILRWYDRSGLLKPPFVNSAGYRFYGERGVELKKIRNIIYEERFARFLEKAIRYKIGE